MKAFIFLLMISLLFTNCKNDKDPEPMQEIAGIAGNWHLSDLKYVVGDSTIAVKVNKEEQKDFFIRYDGVMLYDGKGTCCASKEYLVNGTSFSVIPKEDIPGNPQCASVDCRICVPLVITQKGNEMTIAGCNATSTYTRVN